MTLAGMVALASAEAAAEVIRMAEMGEISHLGQVEELLSSAVMGFLSKYGPQVSQKLADIAAPAAQKASEIIGPVIEQKLKDYVPTFALVTGGVLGVAYLLGVFGTSRKMSGKRRAR